MMLRAGPVAVLAALIVQAEVCAQIVVGPVPGDPGYGIVRITYHRSGLTISGGLSGYAPPGYLLVGPPYPPPVVVKSSPAPRITINNYYNSYPPVLGPGYLDDTRGYDLDQPPPKKSPSGPGEPGPTPQEPPPFKDMPGVDVSKPKAPVRPEDKPAPKPPPKADPREEYNRLVQLGLDAFADGAYGLAAQRFYQATEVDAAFWGGYYLLSQAEFALGKYRDSVAAIHAGMKLEPKWPLLKLQPRVDPYKDRAVDFAAHLKRLQTELAAQPNNATLLFLLGHQLWFDDRRVDALVLFQRARPLTKDPTYIDAFLKAGGPGQIAAN
jgi:hypothetical protein